mgnify:CR=1 FL=1
MVKRRSPARENVTMISTRTSQTIAATKIGTTLISVAALMTGLDCRLALFETATDTPHHVSVALKPAANSHAPKR